MDCLGDLIFSLRLAEVLSTGNTPKAFVNLSPGLRA